MTSVELIRGGRLTEALTTLQTEIRQQPADHRLRLFLFQLDCLLGRLDKALTQLQLVASLDAETMLLAQVFRQVIACELLRREVFAGKRTPLIFGQPLEWIGMLVQANALVAERRFAPAAELRARAFETAPATSGKIDERPFEWIGDADSRLGPLLEIMIEGKYYWVPFFRLAKIQLSKPTDLRDVVWVPARFNWTNGGDVSGFIPVRYPDTENSEDDALRLARKTVWNEVAADCFLGLGQRMLSTDAGEYSLLDCRTIELGFSSDSERRQ
jgi:type VI secretion system protein ImpE